METKLPPASTPTSPSSPGLSPVPPPDKVDGFSRRSLRRARPRRSHSSSQFRYQSNQQELTPLPLLKGELLLVARVPRRKQGRGGPREKQRSGRVWISFRLGTPLELTPNLQASADAWPDWPVISGGGASGSGARGRQGPRVGHTA
jgi:hypothetical protein